MYKYNLILLNGFHIKGGLIIIVYEMTYSCCGTVKSHLF